jgi:hypothetical protein
LHQGSGENILSKTRSDYKRFFVCVKMIFAKKISSLERKRKLFLFQWMIHCKWLGEWNIEYKQDCDALNRKMTDNQSLKTGYG